MSTKPEESATPSTEKPSEPRKERPLDEIADEFVRLALRNLNHNAQVDNPEVR